jgi:hypothetical protein
MDARWESVTARAGELVFGDRGDSYDHPHDDYSRVVDIFRAITGIELSVVDALVFMQCVKQSRFQRGRELGFGFDEQRDNLVDLAGYTECLAGELQWQPAPTPPEEGVS